LVQIPFDFPVHMRPQPSLVTGGTNLADVAPSFAHHGRHGHAESPIVLAVRSRRSSPAIGAERGQQINVLFLLNFTPSDRTVDG
jgi:hypothetical protein